MRHLSPEQFVDVLDGTATRPVRAHADSCESCRAQLEELRALANMAQTADVPEPSPLFWDHLSARVQAAVAAETAERSRSGLLADVGERFAALKASWRILVPVTVGVGALAIALVWTPKPSSVDSSPAASIVAGVVAGDNPVIESTAGRLVASASDAVDATDDESLAFVADLASGLDWNAAAAIGLTPSDGVESTVSDLDDAERVELRRILNEAIGAGVSM